MNFKKFISGVSALTIAASAFAGMAVTASAYTVSLSADVTVAGYKDATFYNFQTNDPAVLPTTGDLRYRDGGSYGLHNYGSGNRSAEVTIPVSKDDIMLIETYNTNGQAVVASINRGTANAAITASSGYTAFDITADADNVTFTVNRYTGIMGAVVLKKDTSAQTADYTVKYVDEDSNSIKADLTGNGVVGMIVPIDTASFVENNKKYIYVSDNSADNTIAADGSTVVTVTYRAAANYNYTVIADQGNTPIASGTAFEGDTIKVAYPKYVNVSGTLYERGVTNKEYNHSFNLEADDKVVILGYTAPETAIENVVFLAEGEDIAGLTASTATNTKIRSSKSGSAYATADTTITTLPAGKYEIHAVLFSASSGGTNLPFTLGNNEFSLSTTENSNWVSVSTDELTVKEDTDLVMKKGGGNNAALDYIYIVKTGEYVPAPQGDFSVVYKTTADVTLTKASSGSGDVDSAPVLAAADKADFVEEGQKYIYVSDDSADVKIAADNSAVVTVTVRAATVYTVTVNGSDGTKIDSISVFEGDSTKYSYPKYTTDDNKAVKSVADENTFTKEVAPTEDTTITVPYTAYEGTAYFVDHEAIASANVGESANYSGGKASRAVNDGVEAFTIASAGTYDITVAAACRNTRNSSVFAVYKNAVAEENLIFNGDVIGASQNTVQSEGIKTKTDVELAEGDVIIIQGDSGNTYVDYVLAVQTAAAEPSVETVTIVIGDASGDGKVNSTDIARIGRYLLKKTTGTGNSGKVMKTPENTDVVIGDASGDGKVNSTDIARIGRYLLKKATGTGNTGQIVEVIDESSTN